MNSDVLDILFENKNKAYGAYSLRKFYSHRLYKSIGVMAAAVTLFTVCAFIPRKEKKKGSTIITQTIVIPETKQEKKKEEIKLVKVKVVSTQKLMSAVLIVPNTVKTDTLRLLKEGVLIGVENIKGDSLTGKGLASIPGQESGQAVDTSQVVSKPPVFNPDLVDNNPDVLPTFPGGSPALIRFLKNNLSNPKDMEEGEMVKVVVKFVVGYDGKLKSFDIVQDGGEAFNKEVIRVLKKMPAWNPGKSKGREVAAYMAIPIRFVPAD